MPLLWANTQLWLRAGALLRVRRFAGGRLYGCEQTAQPDIHRAQIRDLIDFDLCLQLAFPLQNFSRFVGGDGVTPQPKLTSWTRFISGWSAMYFAAAYRRE